MTCDPDLVASPHELPDPETNGSLLYWTCCGLSWYLSPTDAAPHRTFTAWHFAAEALKEVNS